MSASSDPPVQSATWREFWGLWIWRAGVIAIALVCVIDWMVRDTVPILTALFYATPPVVIGVISLTWVGMARLFLSAPRRLPDTRVMRCLLVFGCLCMGQWGIDNFRFRATTVPPNAIKILLWNIGRWTLSDWDRVSEILRKEAPDVIVLAEASHEVSFRIKTWDKHFDDYNVSSLRGGIVVLCRGELTSVSEGGFRGNFYRRMSLEVRQATFDLLLADLKANPLRTRERQLSDTLKAVQSQSRIPSLIAGDLNTPPNSAWFDEWRKTDGLKRAWESAGTGYQATWPMPCPVLTLDHIWGNKPIKFHRCQTGWSLCSDHRFVTAYFTIEPDP